MRIVVVGSIRSGKTVYLASLFRATSFAEPPARRIWVRPTAGNAPAIALDESAANIVMGDVPDATDFVTQYEVDVEFPGSILWGLGQQSVRLIMVDTPGGECMPLPGEPLEPSVLNALNTADCLLVLIPADQERRRDYSARLSWLLQSVRQQKRLNQRSPAFRRLAIAVTMSELLVAERGVRAAEHIENLRGKDVLNDFDPEIVQLARGAVPKGNDWYSLVSVFGFDRLGRAAVEKTAEGWRLRLNGGRFENWQPYRLYEPVEFLARGVRWREPSR